MHQLKQMPIWAQEGRPQYHKGYKIGEGTFGVVSEGKHIGTNQSVALKQSFIADKEEVP